MNIATTTPAAAATTTTRRIVVPSAPAKARASHPVREFGTGYGNSSGYASHKRYVRDWGNARFRFA